MLRKIIYACTIWMALCVPVYAVTENDITVVYWRNNPTINGVTMQGTFGKTASPFINYQGTGTVAYKQSGTGTDTATSCKIDVRGFEEFTIMVNSLNVGSGTNTFTLDGYKGTITTNILTVNHTIAKSETIPISEKYLDHLTLGYSTTGDTNNRATVLIIAGSEQ